MYQSTSSPKLARIMRGISVGLALISPFVLFSALYLLAIMGIVFYAPVEMKKTFTLKYLLVNYAYMAMTISFLIYFFSVMIKYWRRSNRKKTMIRFDEDGVYSALWGPKPLPWSSIVALEDIGKNNKNGVRFIAEPKDENVIALFKSRSWLDKIDANPNRPWSIFGKKQIKFPLFWAQTNWTPNEAKSYLSEFLPAHLIDDNLVG